MLPLGNDGADIIVAVVDSGVDTTHEFLEDRIISSDNLTGNSNIVDGNNTMYDDYGHGTHVTGTIVDCTPENVKIMPVKVFDSNGIGNTLQTSYGMQYAADNGAQVINMSLGAACTDDKNCLLKQEIDSIIAEAAEKGIDPPIFVASAGNSAIDTQYACPARLSTTYDNVVTVAAVDQYDLPAYFSNYGDAVDVCAPGVGINSTLPGNTTGTMSGTSMAAPHVSAAVAMLMLQYPDDSPKQLKDELKNTTVDLGTPGEDSVFGSGRVDFRMASFLSVASVAATSIELKETLANGSIESGDTAELESSVLAEGVQLNALVLPKEATDKSVTYTSSNTNIAVYQDGMVVPKSIGNTTVVASKSGVSNKICAVTVADNWINHAANSYAGGSGTQSNPYLISTASQLAKLAYETRVNQNRYYNTYFKLTNNIDLSAYAWTPIGAVEYKGLAINTTSSFQGIFDGNGYSIINMTVSVAKNRYWEYLGLFGFVRGNSETQKSQIKNLAVLNASVIANTTVQRFQTGILCGTAFYTDISNCFTEGNSSGAGLVGWLSVSSTVKNCYSISYAGLAGLVVSNQNSQIFNSYSTGSVANESDTEHVSPTGFAYGQYLSSSITNSFSVIDAASEIGFMNSKNAGPISNCYYLSSNTYGIKTDSESSTTDLTAKSMSFFTTKSSYTTASNWDSASLWDFDNVWAIDSSYNDGLPYLKTLPKYYSVTGVSLNKSTTTIQKGYTETLTVTAAPTEATNKSVTWSSSDTSIATVDAAGVVTAVSSGTATITVQTLDGGFTASCVVTVDDYGNTLGTAYDYNISLGELNTLAGTLEYKTDVDMIKLVVPVTANYEITSTNSTVDVKAWLYNSSGALLTSNDDGNGNLNFKITYTLTAGQTYYLKISHYNQNGTGNYTVNITTLAPLDTSYNVNINTAGKEVSFKFTPTTSGVYQFYSENNGSTDTYGYLYDADGYQLSYNDDGGGSLNFSIKYWLTAGQTYYYKAKLYSSSSTGTFDVKLVATTATTYTITYDGNGSSVSGVPSSDTKVSGTSLTLSRATPTRDGYIFLGWSTSSAATTPTYYKIGTHLTFSTNANVTLYAVWCKQGDVDLDGSVTVSDVVTLRAHVSGSTLLTGYYLIAADVNRDGTINDDDVTDLRDIIMSGSSSSAAMAILLDSIIDGTSLESSVLSESFLADTDWNSDGVISDEDVVLICGVLSETQESSIEVEQLLSNIAQ